MQLGKYRTVDGSAATFSACSTDQADADDAVVAQWVKVPKEWLAQTETAGPKL